MIEELKSQGIANGLEDLLSGRLDVYSTVDVHVQQIVNAALERGLVAHEARHPRARGLVQGAVVVLGNGDGRVLAEAGGRRRYKQPGCVLRRFQPRHQLSSPAGIRDEANRLSRGVRSGALNLESVVPDEPISVPDGANEPKWIANYDGQFKGPISARRGWRSRGMPPRSGSNRKLASTAS